MSSSPQRPLVIDPTRTSPLQQDAALLSPYSSGSEDLLSREPSPNPPRRPSILLPMAPHQIGARVFSNPLRQNSLPTAALKEDTRPYFPPPSAARREPGYFNANLERFPQQASAGFNGSFIGFQSSPTQRPSFEITPRRLHDALESRGGGRQGDAGGVRDSLASEVSLSHSEANLLSNASVIDDRGFGSPRAGFAVTSIDSASPLPEEQRFSNVPTIFDVAPARRGSNKSAGVQVSEDSPGERGSKTVTDTEQSYEVPGSYSTSTRPDMPSTVRTTNLRVGPAPILSLTAGAAIGQEVISGNRTLEISSVGSDETASRKRHYEGCMLCSALPSPTSSISSMTPNFDSRYQQQQGSGPPPDVPLPALIPQIQPPRDDSSTRGAISTPSEFNPLKQYLEGEVATFNPATDKYMQTPTFPPPVLLGGPGPPVGDTFRPQPYSTQQICAQPGPHGSLSTLLEGDEDSNLTQNRQPSHRAQSQASCEAGQRFRSISGEQNRPYTGNTSGTQSVELARVTTTGNISERSLLGVNLPTIPPNAKTHRSRRNIFQKVASPLSHSTGSGISSWGLFGKADPNNNNYEMNSMPPSNISSTLPAAGNMDGITTEPHPGERRDRPGVDGAYEVVDISGPSGNQGSSSRVVTGSPVTRPPSKFKRFMEGMERFGHVRWRFKWILAGVAVVGIILLIVLPVIFFGFPNMAQRAVDGARANITSISITGAATDTVDFKMEVRLMTSGNMNAWIGPEALRLKAIDSKDSIQSKFKRNHIPGHLGNEKSGTLGYLQLAQESAGNDAAVGVILTGNRYGRFFIGDVKGWGKVLEKLVFQKDGVEVELQGNVDVKTGGLKASCQLKKAVKLPGIGGFDIRVANYGIFEGDANFTAQFELQSNSSIVLDFGTVDFHLMYGLTPIGVATVDRFTVSRGISKMTAHGSLNPEVIESNPDLLGRFLSSLFIRTNSNPTTALSLKGRNASVNGIEIEWLVPAVQRLEFALPAVEGGPQNRIFSSFDMGLWLDFNQEKLVATTGFILSSLNLPFASENFGVLVDKVGHTVKLSIDGGPAFARLDTPMVPALATAGKVIAIFPTANMSILDPKGWTQGFLKPLLQETNFSIAVGGNITAEANTVVGNATLQDIILEKTEWGVAGYGGLSRGNNSVALDSVEMLQTSTGDSLQMDVKIRLQGSGQFALKLGDVTFRVLYNSTSNPIGELSIPAFKLVRGAQVLQARMALGDITDRTFFNAFMAAYFAGGGIPLTLDAPAASANPQVAEAMEGLTIPVLVDSPGYSGFLRRVDLVFNNATKILTAAVEFTNLLPVTMAIEGFDLTMTTMSEGAEVELGRLDPLAFSKRELKRGENVRFEVEVKGGVGGRNLAAVFGNANREVEVGGRVAVGFGEVVAEVGLRVERVVGFVVVG